MTELSVIRLIQQALTRVGSRLYNLGKRLVVCAQWWKTALRRRGRTGRATAWL
jgi:hypothetical protein